MGLEDRDWWKEAQSERAKSKTVSFGKTKSAIGKSSNGLTKGLKWAPLGMVFVWLVVMAALYFGFNHFLKPKPLVISASGDLIIPRARDGHFYAAGSVNGKPVNFLVDTGATLVSVSEKFANGAGLASGEPTVFRTANGNLPGRIVSGVPIRVGPIGVSGVRVGVGLEGHDMSDALLGQNFLSKFEITLEKEQMILRKR